MTEPLGAAGLVLAALTVPAQLFSSCVHAYTTVSGIRDAGPAVNRLLWLFKVQQTRFLVWGQVGRTTLPWMESGYYLYTDIFGQNSEIYGSGLNPENLSQPVYEIIVATLIQIQDLLQNVSK